MPIIDEQRNTIGDGDVGPIRVAEYVRMSTEHQQYSTENQGDVLREYAGKRGMAITKTFADEGKSGLKIEGRDALKRLIAEVESGEADFDAILVYDVSRWGRFQDADESAYYEYICKRAGIAVHYCNEQFENDGSPTATIIKCVKRSMAGEYSRELSGKVFQGQCRLIQLGYRQGGPAGYGLRRMLVDEHGEPKGILERGQQKSLQTDRVILVPGPPEEVETVRLMYRMFGEQGKGEAEIAAELNADGARTDLGREWTRATVHQVLTNEKYIGNNVYNRRSYKLKRKHVVNPPDMWIRSDGAFEGIVDSDLFHVVRGMILARSRRYSDEEMLDRLKHLYEQHSRLSGLVIDESGDVPSSAAYRSRFGSLVRAYRLVGYTPERDYRYLEINRHLRRMHPEMVSEAMAQIERLGGHVMRDEKTDLLTVNGEYSTSIVISRCRQTPAGSLRWLIRIDQSLAPDITVAVRMDADNQTALDYYLFPLIDLGSERMRLADFNGVYLDTYRFDTLNYFFGMAERSRIEVAA